MSIPTFIPLPQNSHITVFACSIIYIISYNPSFLPRAYELIAILVLVLVLVPLIP